MNHVPHAVNDPDGQQTRPTVPTVVRGWPDAAEEDWSRTTPRRIRHPSAMLPGRSWVPASSPGSLAGNPPPRWGAPGERPGWRHPTPASAGPAVIRWSPTTRSALTMRLTMSCPRRMPRRWAAPSTPCPLPRPTICRQALVAPAVAHGCVRRPRPAAAAPPSDTARSRAPVPLRRSRLRL